MDIVQRESVPLTGGGHRLRAQRLSSAMAITETARGAINQRVSLQPVGAAVLGRGALVREEGGGVVRVLDLHPLAPLALVRREDHATTRTSSSVATTSRSRRTYVGGTE